MQTLLWPLLWPIRWIRQYRFNVWKLGIILCLLSASLQLGCSMEEPATTPVTSPPPTASTPPDPAPPAEQPQLSEAVRDTLLAAIATDQSVSVDQLQLLDATAQTWTDGCLGLAEPDEICTMALVEGWSVTVTHGEQTWTYRTDSSGEQIRLESEA